MKQADSDNDVGDNATGVLVRLAWRAFQNVSVTLESRASSRKLTRGAPWRALWHGLYTDVGFWSSPICAGGSKIRFFPGAEKSAFLNWSGASLQNGRKLMPPVRQCLSTYGFILYGKKNRWSAPPPSTPPPTPPHTLIIEGKVGLANARVRKYERALL